MPLLLALLLFAAFVPPAKPLRAEEAPPVTACLFPDGGFADALATDLL